MASNHSGRKRVLEDRSTAWLGSIAVLTLTAVIAATTLLTSLHLGKTTYYADFRQAASIRSGDEVSIAGIPVGTVDQTTLAGDHVVVSMKIRRDVVLGAQTEAAIKLTTVLGARYIQLKPGGDGTLPDRRITVAHTSVPYDLQKVLQDSTSTFEEVDAEQFAQSMQTAAKQLQGVPSILPDALTNVQNLSQVIADRRDQIAGLLRSTAQVADILGGQQADLTTLVKQGQQLFGEIIARRDAVLRLMDAATTLVNTTRDVTVGDSAQLDQVLAGIRQVTAMVGDHDDLLRNLFQAMPLSMRNVANATGTGPFLNFALPGGLMVDSWMCAISGRAEQWHWPERYQYFKDCE
ncbi:MCE family protein [Mycobacterium sp. pUA109]|uniref:MCE family protein n=1 Tax=Mycobacterium sp. pUA109 TaxID=3238982 RepID=UPI00351BD9A4